MQRIAFLLMLVSAPAVAHHAANAFFGGDVVIIEGTLRGAKIVNPHSYLRLTMDNGTDWVFETQQSGTVLRQSGFTADMFANGRRVLMSGDSNQDGKKVARWRTFTFVDETDHDFVEIYIVGRIPQSGLIDAIRNRGVTCDNGIENCFRISAPIRAQIDNDFPDEPKLW